MEAGRRRNHPRLLLCLLSSLAVLTACQPTAAPPPPADPCAGVNTLTAAEKSAGWELLFDGKSMSGWHGYNGQSLQAWAIEDCALKTVGTEGNYGSDLRADLATDRELTSFEISLDWKATKGGNSGLMYGVVEDKRYDTGVEDRPRVPVHRRHRVPREAQGVAEGRRQLRHAPPQRGEAAEAGGEWNNTRIVVNGSHVEHWLNGRKILEFERWNDEWQKLRDSGKWKEAPDYGLAKTGRLVLQDHGRRVLVPEHQGAADRLRRAVAGTRLRPRCGDGRAPRPRSRRARRSPR